MAIFRVKQAYLGRRRAGKVSRILPPCPVGYGVIGSPSDSGSLSLGSSPGTPASVESSVIRRHIDWGDPINKATRPRCVVA